MIVDNYATHKHEKVKTWLKQNNRVHLHFIPTSSSWLNLVERFFGLLTERQLRRGVFTSVKELEEAIMKFIDTHNESAFCLDKNYGRDFPESVTSYPLNTSFTR